MVDFDYVTHFFIDDQEVTHEEWSAHLEQDINIEEQTRTWSLRGAIYTDISNGRDININGHEYKTRCDFVFHTAKSLLIEMMAEGYSNEILEALEHVQESEAQAVIQHIERVKINGHKFILQDEKDF